MKTFKDLIAWQKAMGVATEIYRVTGKFPKEEIYGLTNQMRRAAVSIPSNLAEGFGRNTQAEMIRFSNIAMGSVFELLTQIEIAYNIGFINELTSNELTDSVREVERILSGFIKSLHK